VPEWRSSIKTLVLVLAGQQAKPTDQSEKNQASIDEQHRQNPK
jgi:hypothetical protein